MPTEIKGHASCPECGSKQEVKHDGRKLFISCSECRTFTSYQSKAAKERIQKKLIPLAPLPETTDTIKVNTGKLNTKKPEEPKPKKVYKPVSASDGFFSFIDDVFSSSGDA